MAFAFTITLVDPLCDKRYQEVGVIKEALHAAAQQLGGGNGQLTGGPINILIANGKVAGTFTYTPGTASNTPDAQQWSQAGYTVTGFCPRPAGWS